MSEEGFPQGSEARVDENGLTRPDQERVDGKDPEKGDWEV